VYNRDEQKAFDYLKKLKNSVQVYTKHGGGGTVPVRIGQAGMGIFFIVDAMKTQQSGYDVVLSFPIAYLTLKGILAGIDPNVEDMAFSLGSSRWRVFRTVTLPLSVPGLANALLLLFAASLADFATPLILAGNSFPVLPTEAFLQITGLYDLKGGATLSFVLLIPSFIIFFLQRFWVSCKNYVTITGKAGA